MHTCPSICTLSIAEAVVIDKNMRIKFEVDGFYHETGEEFFIRFPFNHALQPVTWSLKGRPDPG